MATKNIFKGTIDCLPSLGQQYTTYTVRNKDGVAVGKLQVVNSKVIDDSKRMGPEGRLKATPENLPSRFVLDVPIKK